MKKKFEREDKKINNSKDCNCIAEVAFPNIKSEFITFGKGETSITIEKKDNNYVLGGDILLTPEQVNYIKNSHENPKGYSLKTAFILNKKWPDAIVYYTIDPTIPASYRITDAMAHWESNTPIRFVPRTTQTNYVKFINGSGCSSYIGMIGGEQQINLASGCSTGNTIHEIGHAVGLFHEQTRNDRDSYINIHNNNIEPGYEFNFRRYIFSYSGTEIGDFDFNSIMLYSSYDFSKNNQPTITKKDGSTFYSQRSYLSTKDIEGINYLYLANPNGNPCGVMEFENIGSTGADVYISFYTNYKYTTRMIPNASIVFKYDSFFRWYDEIFSGESNRESHTIQNTNNQNRIYIGRCPPSTISQYNDPQYGDLTQIQETVFVVTPGQGYNSEQENHSW